MWELFTMLARFALGFGALVMVQIGGPGELIGSIVLGAIVMTWALGDQR